MIYAFADLELDLGRMELRRGAALVPIEPQVFALLTLLVENHDRMVSRDEIVERVWDGRIVSEAAISSRIKSARQAVGDDGHEQRIIRTVHGRGFRCVADVRIADGVPAHPTARVPEAGEKGREGSSMPSIAVLPFRHAGGLEPYGTLPEAVPHEIISALSRLRWLKVIARASSFRFREDHPDAKVVGRTLGARYCLTGFMVIDQRAISVSVELVATADGRIVWNETYGGPVDAIHEIRERITASVVAALETHVPLNEAQAARLADPQNLDAWAVYHLGLQRMFRFSPTDNAEAASHFEAATRLESGFARAYAGLSFTRFQNAYLGYAPDRARNAAEAKAFAETAVGYDGLDPFAAFTLGRAYWLEGDLEASLGWLERSCALSPSYAQGVYARAWAQTMLGRAAEGRTGVDTAIDLSPLDPFLFAMRGTRALSYIVEGRAADAVFWIDEAARTPGANAVVNLVAAVAHQLNGDSAGAAEWVRRARTRNPSLGMPEFFAAIPFADAEVRRRVAAALARHGL